MAHSNGSQIYGEFTSDHFGEIGTFTITDDDVQFLFMVNDANIALDNIRIQTNFSDSSMFIVGDTAMTWQEAEDWCLVNHGSHLLSIHNDTQNEAAISECGDCWI